VSFRTLSGASLRLLQKQRRQRPIKKSDGTWPDPTQAYFWPTVNQRLTRLWPGYFLTQPDKIFLIRRAKNWKILWFFGEIFQTQTKDGWPDPNTKNLTQPENCRGGQNWWVQFFLWPSNLDPLGVKTRDGDPHKTFIKLKLSVRVPFMGIFLGSLTLSPQGYLFTPNSKARNRVLSFKQHH